MRYWLAVGLLAALGCGDDDHAVTLARPANQVVRERIAAYQPTANFGHRGSGINQSGNLYPENSLAAFTHGLAEGADAAELDVNLTADGKLVVIHDDTLDRTTTCQGCVSAKTLAEIRECRLTDGNGNVSNEPPPTLPEVYAALPPDTLVSVELKLYGAECRTPDTGAMAIAQAAIAEIHRLDVAARTIFCSFDADAAAAVKTGDPVLYSALLVTGLKQRNIDQAVQLGLDGIEPGGVFPFVQLPVELLHNALTQGLQVHVWTVDDVESMNAMIDAGVSSIITNQPRLLASVIAARLR